MSLKKITKISGRAVVLPGNDVDTDRIIPARYMKVVTFDGLGEFLFRDVRFDENGKQKKHPLNEPQNKGANILIVENNFGCGSSREHAPQAIHRAGFDAIIGEGFAEIFFGNSTTLGMPCVNLSRENLTKLMQLVEKNPATEVTVNLEKQVVTAGQESFSFTLRESAREGLINGKWDAISDLLEGLPLVDEVAAKLPYMAAR